MRRCRVGDGPEEEWQMVGFLNGKVTGGGVEMEAKRTFRRTAPRDREEAINVWMALVD
jgi:hypothetical protein